MKKTVFWCASMWLVFASSALLAMRITAPSGLDTKVKGIASNSNVLEFIHLLKEFPLIQADTVITNNGDTVLKMLEEYNQAEMLAHLHWHSEHNWGIYGYPLKNPIAKAAGSGDLESTIILTDALRWQLANTDRKIDETPTLAEAKFLMPALDIALKEQNDPISNYLLEKADYHRYMVHAVRLNYLHLAKYLIEHSLSTIDDEWLYDAVSKGHVEMVNLLIEAGADVNWQKFYYDSGGGFRVSILQEALSKTLKLKANGQQIASYLKVVKLLLDNEAKLRLGDKRKLQRLGIQY